MKTLIIAEKPDMGRNIAAVIEPRAKNNRTHLEGEHFIITWAIGHLIGLAEPDLYDPKYKKWSMEHLPIIPEQFQLVPHKSTQTQLNIIKDLAKRCDQLVNCCDAGREGQYIFSLIQRYLKLKQPVKRLWISDLTPETIRKGFEELKDESVYANLTKAARARSEADWLIGMNGSRAFTTKHQVLMSVGRVQTPVLALIYDRQVQIEAFTSLKYFEAEATFEQNTVTYKGLWQGERITKKEEADAIAARTSNKEANIASYDVKNTKEYPYKLYDLTLLQREANGKLGFSAKKTLDVAQALYEKHKVISYPRTNSNYVTEQNISQMHQALNALQRTGYKQWADRADRSLVHKGNKSICNAAKVEDHHAILPTNKTSGGLSGDEQKLYDMIVKRFLAQFYPAAEYKLHAVVTNVGNDSFKTNIKERISLGWKELYSQDQKEEFAKKNSKKAKGEQEDTEQEVEVNEPFHLNKLDPVWCMQTLVKEKDTQPPKHYTEGTLLKAMESAGKQIEDDEVRDAMKDSGLGTPATRAATIERLKKVGYIDMQGKRIAVTQKGRTAIELIRGAGVELLASPEMTGMWEKRLNEIARGSASEEQFMNNVKRFATMVIEKVKVQRPAAKHLFEMEKGKERVQRQEKKEKSAKSSKTATKKAETASSGFVAVCPRTGCGGSLFMGRKGYGCSNYKSGCGFVIWKECYGRSLTDTQVKALVEKGRTAKLKLIAADGKEVQAKIILKNKETGEVATEQ